MSSYLWWLALTVLTGSPVRAAIILLVVWLVADRFTLGVLPDPLRWLGRLKRELAVRRTIATNPHDRRARLELAELLVWRRSYRRAVEVLRPSLEQGQDDVQTLFTMGQACLGAGYAAQGEQLLGHAREVDPAFRGGEIDLVVGRARLERGDQAGAREALERLVKVRGGTVEGRVLLSRALAAAKDDAGAALLRAEAWREYEAAPRFVRRRERLWAWRARPSRPLLYASVLLAVLGLFAALAGRPPSHPEASVNQERYRGE